MSIVSLKSEHFSDHKSNSDYEGMLVIPQRFNQDELNDLNRDLNLS